MNITEALVESFKARRRVLDYRWELKREENLKRAEAELRPALDARHAGARDSEVTDWERENYIVATRARSLKD